ncbi:MAG: Gfo/Idh/MocA family oxidoreductase [Bacteroidota bacterium]
MAHSRRRFMQTLAAASALPFSPAFLDALHAQASAPRRAYGPNDTIRLASIGMGIIGFANVERALRVPGVELVAVADCYDGRLRASQEQFGAEVATTRDYQELLQRDDIDAVFINTPDHWHAQQAVDALSAGKHVRCEKPMVQHIADGQRIIDAERASGKILHVGSSGINAKGAAAAADLLQQGVIGELNMAESWVSRNSAIGAWQYSIPTDASPQTIDWKRFTGPAPDRLFDADRFFRWRKYWDYGTGIAGDMFVHRFTKFHRITASLGPVSTFSTGQISQWNDGREVPDIQTAMYTYPETTAHPAFTLMMNANLADGSGGAGDEFRLIGSHGVMTVNGDNVTVERTAPGLPSENGVLRGYNSVRTFDAAEQAAFADAWRQYRPEVVKAPDTDPIAFNAEDYDLGYLHIEKFFLAMRGETTIQEDATYGLRAAAPSLMANMSYRSGQPVRWDPLGLRLL